MNANPWKVSDECRAAVAELIARRARPTPGDDTSRALTDAILSAVEEDIAGAARAAFERWRRPSDN